MLVFYFYQLPNSVFAVSFYVGCHSLECSNQLVLDDVSSCVKARRMTFNDDIGITQFSVDILQPLGERSPVIKIRPYTDRETRMRRFYDYRVPNRICVVQCP